MKKNNKLNEIVKSAEIQPKEKKTPMTFKDQIIKRIDAKSKSIDQVEYFAIRTELCSALDKLEKLIIEEKNKAKQIKNTFKKLSKFSETDIRAYLSQINEVKK